MVAVMKHKPLRLVSVYGHLNVIKILVKHWANLDINRAFATGLS